MVTECFSNGDIEDDIVGIDERDRNFQPEEESELIPRNNLTGSQKLQLALSMVEPIAALHNFQDGVIVHDDIQARNTLADIKQQIVDWLDFISHNCAFFHFPTPY
jgi:hypothetical protein